MSPRKALLSVLQLFAGFSFFAAAIFFFTLPFLPKVRLQISDLLLASPEVCHKVGAVFLTVSFIVIGGFYFLTRGRSLTIRMEGEERKTTVSAAVIERTLDACLRSHFNGSVTLTDVIVLSGNKLEIEVCLTPLKEVLREELFADVQKQIIPLLSERFGYSKPCDLIVTLSK